MEKYKKSYRLPNGSYSASDMQHYFEYNLQKHEKVMDNLSIGIM